MFLISQQPISFLKLTCPRFFMKMQKFLRMSNFFNDRAFSEITKTVTDRKF